MTAHEDVLRVVSASRDIAASAERIFELIADPAQQPRWDGNDNLAEAPGGQRVRALGQMFTMTTTRGQVRENHVVEFDEGRLIAWRPAEPGKQPPGHLWRWALEPIGPSRTRVTHTYDWTELTDEGRFARAQATTVDKLHASLDRLATLAESERTVDDPPTTATPFDPRALLAHSRLGVLATIKSDGRPQLSPVMPHYDRDTGVIYISTSESTAKVANLRRDPRAALEVTSADGWQWATAEGVATLTGPGTDPHGPEVDALVHYYRTAAGEHPDWDEYRSVMVSDNRVLITMTIDHLYGAQLN